jgi:S-DNA-T family DNA segregation ATPase FtsK/SpoIIIE
MPFVNVIRGEVLPDAVLTVRTPHVRVPVWLLITGWCAKHLALGLVLAVRGWYVTGPVLLVGWLWWRYGWPGPAILAAGVALAAGVWWWVEPGSFGRCCTYPLLARARRWAYRRRWWAAMATTGLVVRFDRHEVLPILKRVRSRPGADELLVRMVTGQLPDDYAAQAERFAHTFRVRAVRVHPHPRRRDLVGLTLLRGDPLATIVKPLPVTATPEFTGLPLGLREDGQTYRLRLFGSQVLVAGATGAGKGSVIWSLIRALAGGVGTGLVQLWGFDPKGGMELGPGMPLFAEFACEDYQAMAELLDQAVATARQRAARLRGITRQHQPSQAEPLLVIVVDELAALTAYLTDRKLKERIKNALGLLLSQGRAVGVHVLAAIQDPRKEVLPFRDLFPTRIGLRLAEAPQVDLVLGEGMRDRGAWCDRIPQTQPGIGYVVLDGDPTPARVRFSYLSDADITAMATTYGRLRVIDSTATIHTDHHDRRWAA